MLVCEIVTSYGFKFFEKESGEEVCAVSDVFTDAEKAESFKMLVNESGVDAKHIKDILDDMMGK